MNDSLVLLFIAILILLIYFLARKNFALDSKNKMMSENLEIAQKKLLEFGKVSIFANLSAGIVHQLAQPVTAIHGFSRFLRKEMDPKGDFYRPICLIDEQSDYLKQMLQNLMELMRHKDVQKEHINVNDVVKKAMNLLTDELRIRRINWDLALEENPPLVYADSIHLQQIFMNIVINAMQALGTLPSGSERYIKISSKCNQHISIFFKDTGPGIGEQEKEHIFEPFFSKKSDGSGIGLSLCRELIKDHGGRIFVESEGGQGATFVVELPVVQR